MDFDDELPRYGILCTSADRASIAPDRAAGLVVIGIAQLMGTSTDDALSPFTRMRVRGFRFDVLGGVDAADLVSGAVDERLFDVAPLLSNAGERSTWRTRPVLLPDPQSPAGALRVVFLFGPPGAATPAAGPGIAGSAGARFDSSISKKMRGCWMVALGLAALVVGGLCCGIGGSWLRRPDCTAQCAHDGRCEAVRYGSLVDPRFLCEAVTDAHCRAAAVCREEGECTHGGAGCTVSGDADCAASRLCSTSGRCVVGRSDLVGTTCVVPVRSVPCEALPERFFSDLRDRVLSICVDRAPQGGRCSVTNAECPQAASRVVAMEYHGAVLAVAAPSFEYDPPVSGGSSAFQAPSGTEVTLGLREQGGARRWRVRFRSDGPFVDLLGVAELSPPQERTPAKVRRRRR